MSSEKSLSEEDQLLSRSSEYVNVDRIKLKDGMSYEALVAQVQGGTKKVLCVDDGVYLRIFEESGPFPLGVEFEHKQKRYGETEYFFRYARDTEDERSLCVFGRDNAETFCPDYVDDQDTESENSSEEENMNHQREELLEDVFSTSSEESSEIAEELSLREEVQSLLSTKKSKNHESPERSYIKPSDKKIGSKEEKEKVSSDEVLVKHEALSPEIQVIEIEAKPSLETELQQKMYDLS